METVMSDAFYPVVDLESVRRQARMSIVIIAAMAIGAFILGFATPIPGPQKATIMDDGAAFSGRLVSLIDE
jgi:hypothetical protein